MVAPVPLAVISLSRTSNIAPIARIPSPPPPIEISLSIRVSDERKACTAGHANSPPQAFTLSHWPPLLEIFEPWTYMRFLVG